MQRAWITAAFIFAFFLSPASASATDLAQLKHEYEAAKKIDNDPDFPGYGISALPGAHQALEDEWSIVTEWLLDAFGPADALDGTKLAHALDDLDRDYGASVLKLDSNSYLIGISRVALGTIFVVRKIGGKWVVVWEVRQIAPDEIGRVPLIGAWTIKGFEGTCREKLVSTDWDRCGPLAADNFGLLPEDANGHVRFYVDAWYAQLVGETNSFQLSIWSWDGKSAVPLFAKSFMQMTEIDHTPVLVDGVLRVRIKTEFHNFDSCGACPGRQAEWSRKLTPTGVQYLGTVSRMPEVDAIDELIGRIAHGKPTADVAAPSIAKALAPLVAAQEDESHKIGPNWVSLGMIGNGEAEANPANPAERLVCFSTDADDDRRIFTLERRETGFYISKMHDIGQGDTPDKLCTKPND